LGHCIQRHSVRIVAFNKCGHASIINSFTAAVGEKPHRGPSSLQDISQIGDYKKAKTWDEPIVTIAFFRHPLARVASVWNKLMRETWYTSFHAHGFTKGMTFEEFCEHLLFIQHDNPDPHLRPQADQFRECRGWSGDTYIMRLDEISTAWPQMIRTWDLDCTTQMLHLNRSHYPDGKPWTAMYEGREQIAFNLCEMYREDLQIWRDRAVP